MSGPFRGSRDKPAPFSICYSPESGYCASRGESLDMRFEIVAADEFREPVDVKIRIKVPDPAVGLFTVYNQVHDLGVHSYPYPPLYFTQNLDPYNPPKGYEFVKKAYAAAKRMKIDAIDVHVEVTALGGGFVCEERSLYRVNL